MSEDRQGGQPSAAGDPAMEGPAEAGPGGPTPAEVERVRATADEIHSPAAVDAALDRLAAAVHASLAERNPVLLAVMNGGVVPAVRLQRRLRFLHQFDYVHATRYASGTRGGEIRWLARPRIPLAGRAALIVDDILDEGHTLKAIQAWCREQGVGSLHTAVLTIKRHDRRVAGVAADFVGLEVPDRYVFGVGMDYREYLRELNGIYALHEPQVTD
jgi:hypoxanthine phosphoribosyltransferase